MQGLVFPFVAVAVLVLSSQPTVAPIASKMALTGISCWLPVICGGTSTDNILPSKITVGALSSAKAGVANVKTRIRLVKMANGLFPIRHHLSRRVISIPLHF
jgi:hypothetical protein